MHGKEEFQDELFKVIGRYRFETTDLNRINELINNNFEYIRILQANYDNLMVAFEAQKEEMRKSRVIFKDKKREWANYKTKSITKSKHERENERAKNETFCWTKIPKTPPGFWNVDFTSK